MISFEPLWKTMKEKDVSVYDLLEKHKFSHGTYDSIKKNKNVTLNTIDQLCKILHCNVRLINKSDTPYEYRDVDNGGRLNI
ncbi:MAG: helix-turn-helix transcriptional regulator, partial [Lachnospiraceae bacterium]|nr:helix-turn-helix transcriptional regulator [Lachnospiraceae bacterium]